MSLDAQNLEDRPISRVDELIAFFRAAERPNGPGLIGLEHEKLLMPVNDLGAVPYEGPSGIGALLEGFAAFGWHPIRERSGAPVIAMQRGRATLTLEPGGQFELAGSPFATAKEAHDENVAHAAELRQVTARLGLRVVALGYRPFWSLPQMPWMPKTRYSVMRSSLGARGPLAHDMMLMTATGQVSLDWRDEADCARKVTAAARLSPVLVALYANSPIVGGRPSGFQSYRSRVWNDVDRARCGYPDALLDGHFDYRRYVEWALDAPLLFLRRRGEYLTPALTFGQLLAQGFEGKPAQHSDWVDHLSTLFPEVRLKRVIEIRAADCNGLAMTGALGALMRGLLYDETALSELLALLPALPPDEHRAWHAAVQRRGLETPWHGATVARLAREVLQVASSGLKRLDPTGADAALLAPLHALAESGRSPAVGVLEAAQQSPEALLAVGAL